MKGNLLWARSRRWTLWSHPGPCTSSPSLGLASHSCKHTQSSCISMKNIFLQETLQMSLFDLVQGPDGGVFQAEREPVGPCLVTSDCLISGRRWHRHTVIHALLCFLFLPVLPVSCLFVFFAALFPMPTLAALVWDSCCVFVSLSALWSLELRQ